MYCKECGKEISELAKVCEHCGAMTRKGVVFKNIKKKVCMCLGIIALIIIGYNVLVFSGTIDNIKSMIAQSKLEKELKSNTKNTLENYNGNKISICTDNASGEIIYVGEDIYIVNAGDQANDYMFYSSDGKTYKSVECDKFLSISNELPLYESYLNVLSEVVDSMELTEYDASSAVFGGTLDNTDDLLMNYNNFLLLFGAKPVETDSVLFNLTISREAPTEIVLGFNINNDDYQVILSSTEEKPEDIIKGNIVSKGIPLDEVVCYDSEKDIEVVIYNDNLRVNEEFELVVRFFVNGEENQVAYDSIKVLDEGIMIEDVTYPYGTKEEYERILAQKKENLAQAEKYRDELLLAIEKCVTLNKEYALYRARSSSYEEYGFFSKETVTNRWLEDCGDKIMITEITPTLVEDGLVNVNYIVECKGYYIYDGEKREFSGELQNVLEHIELKVKDVNEHLVRCVGFSTYRVVAEPDRYFFGTDMKLRRKGEINEEINYAE